MAGALSTAGRADVAVSGQFPRTRSRFDRPSRLDSRSAIFRTGRRLAAPRGATRRKEREQIPTGRRTLAGRRRLMTTMERFGRKNAEMTSPCSNAGSTTSCSRPGHDIHGDERHRRSWRASRRSGSRCGARRRARQGRGAADAGERLVGAAAGRRTDGDGRQSGSAAASAAGAVRTDDGVHVVVHVEERWQAPRRPGFADRFAGRELRLRPTNWPLINKTQSTCHWLGLPG